MSTYRTAVSWVLCFLSLVTLAGCFGKPIKIKREDAAIAETQADATGGVEEAGPADGPAPLADSKISGDGPSANGGTGGDSGIVDSSVGGSGDSANGGSSADDSGAGGSDGSTGGGIAGSSGNAPDAAPDVPPDAQAVDAPGTCSVDKECPSQSPLCLGNKCAKCSGDSDCIGRAGPACATSGLCVACTANKHCTGVAATCDAATNQCVGCASRSDCAGTCQTCASGACTAVKGKADPGFCDGTCDSAGACKKAQGQSCQKIADCAGGIPCADGVCCDKACTGFCEACDVASSLGTCTTLAADATPHANHPVCAATDAACAGKCSGNSAACSYPTTACGTASCTGKSYQAAGTCNNGACQIPDPQTCTSVCVLSAGGCKDCTPSTKQCSTGGIPQLCLANGTWQNQPACGTGTTCSAGDCAAKISNSGACPVGNNDACQSGNCSSGLCCPAGQSNSGGICCGGGLTNSNGVCCSAGQTGCNGTCVDLQANSLYCGSCTHSCNGLSCCSGTCVDTRVSLSNCGSCGNSCGGTCLAGSCCVGSFLTCGSASNCGAWDFEDASTQGWKIDTLFAGNAATNVAVTSTRHHGGQYSLAVTVRGYVGPAYVSTPLCPNGSATNVTGFNLSAWVYLDPTYSPSKDESGFYAIGSDQGGINQGVGVPSGTLRAGTWINVRGSMSPGPLLDSISLGFDLSPSPAQWDGTVYIDDVVLSAP